MEPLAPSPVTTSDRSRARARTRRGHRGVRRDDFPTDAAGGTRRVFAGAVQRPASAAEYLQGPVRMTMTQRTTSFLWCEEGNHRWTRGARWTDAIEVIGATRSRLACPVTRSARGWLRGGRSLVGRRGDPGVPCARSRARSSVGERCLHTAEVRGSIPLVPTSKNRRSGPVLLRSGSRPFPVPWLRGTHLGHHGAAPAHSHPAGRDRPEKRGWPAASSPRRSARSRTHRRALRRGRPGRDRALRPRARSHPGCRDPGPSPGNLNPRPS